MGVGRAGTVGGRAKSPVAAVVSVTCQAAAAVCSAYVAYGTAAGVGAGRAGTAEGGRKDRLRLQPASIVGLRDP